MRSTSKPTSSNIVALPETPYLGMSRRQTTTRLAVAGILFSVVSLLCIQSAKAQVVPAKCLEMQPNAKRVLDAGRVAVEGVTSSTAYSENNGCDFYVMELPPKLAGSNGLP